MSDVVYQRHELPFIGHMIRGISAVIGSSRMFMLFIEILAISPVKALDNPINRDILHLNDKMVMIIHQNIVQQPEAVFISESPYHVKEGCLARLRCENVVAVMSSLNNVIALARLEISSLSSDLTHPQISSRSILIRSVAD